MNETKPLALELDVYNYILTQVAASNQTASSFLRQELRMPNAASAPAPGPGSVKASSDLEALLHSTRFLYARGVVGRFLLILSWLFNRHRENFALVENIRGRGRLYFATSPEPLNASGRSVNPQKIPDSDYWVITTSPTDLKQETLGNVMRAFGYSQTDILRAKAAIAESSRRRRQQILSSL
jgi:negative modulator of initiation of replication